MSEEDLIARTPEPATIASLTAELRELGVEPGMTVLVHSSLRALGWVSGGPVAVVQALMDAVTPAGTLVMPAHSANLSDPAGWVNPPVPLSWVAVIRATMPAYDPRTTPTYSIGRIAESFRTWPDVVRSAHPLSSFAAWGKGAPAIVEGHTLADSLGETSPLARLYDRDAAVLLLGVGHGVNTSFHLAEYRAGHAALGMQSAPVRDEQGQRVWTTFEDIVLDDDPFALLGVEFERAQPTGVRLGRVGLADARLFSQRAAVDYAVLWLRRRRAVSALDLT